MWDIFAPFDLDLWVAIIFAVLGLGVLITLLESRYQPTVRFTVPGIYRGMVVSLGKMIGGVDHFEITTHLGMVTLVGIMFMSMLINATYTVCVLLRLARHNPHSLLAPVLEWPSLDVAAGESGSNPNETQ